MTAVMGVPVDNPRNTDPLRNSQIQSFSLCGTCVPSWQLRSYAMVLDKPTRSFTGGTEADS